MITVHNLENSQSFRVVWLLEELGIPYEIKQYKRDPATSFAPADYKELHPIGTSPTISMGTWCWWRPTLLWITFWTSTLMQP